MNTLEELFPPEPTYRGRWQTIYIEPIVGSGERVAIAALAMGVTSEYKIIQAIREELLDCLYGSQASNMHGMIEWVIESISKEIKMNGVLDKWVPPFDGVIIGEVYEAADENIEGILRQAVRFSASLSALALDADRGDDDEQPKKYTEQWARSIADEIKFFDPHLTSHFNKKIKISEANILTSYGFLSENFVSNFGLLVPMRLSSSLSSVKAKLFDLEALKKANILIKPKKYEVIIGTPSLDDPTLSDKAVMRLQDTLEMVSEIAEAEDISVYRAENAKQAAEHIYDLVA
ncbi:MAG: hypothetical protein KAT04_15170 [Methylococcales bacterium]|nr:hypothetical protein [Methylococcales bacterium]